MATSTKTFDALYKIWPYGSLYETNKVVEELQNRKSELNLPDSAALDSVLQKMSLHESKFGECANAQDSCMWKLNQLSMTANEDLRTQLNNYTTRNAAMLKKVFGEDCTANYF